MTAEEIKKEMRKIKMPWFIKFADKFWFKGGRYITIFGILSFVPLGIIYNSVTSIHTANMLWNIMIGIFLFLLLGVGGVILISHLMKNIFVKKHSKRIGISTLEWNEYAKDLGLTSF